MTMAISQPMRQFLSRPLKALFLSTLPAEWSSAGEVLNELIAIENGDPAERRKSRIWTAVQFLAGGIPAFYVATRIDPSNDSLAGTFVAALLAFSALIVGFIVTLMLFTGSVGNVAVLNLEQLKGHISRVKYLLSSQATTLGAALLVAFLSILWLGLYIAKAPEIIIASLSAVIGGFFLIALIRTGLLPLQIFELHSATLHDALQAKADETRKRYDK